MARASSIAPEVLNTSQIPDDEVMYFGDSQTADSGIEPDNTQTNDMVVWWVGSGMSRTIMIADLANRGNDYAFASQTNPTLVIFSATASATATNQWISFAHDQTRGVLTTGTGAIRLSPNSNVVEINTTLQIGTATDDPRLTSVDLAGAGWAELQLAAQGNDNTRLILRPAGTSTLSSLMLANNSSTADFDTLELRVSGATVTMNPNPTGAPTAITLVAFNSGLLDVDHRISGDNTTNLLYVDASIDRIGINTATPIDLLDVNGAVRVSSLRARSATEILIAVSNPSVTVGSEGSLLGPYLANTSVDITDAQMGDVNGCLGLHRDTNLGVSTIEGRVNGAWVSTALTGMLMKSRVPGPSLVAFSRGDVWLHLNQIIDIGLDDATHEPMLWVDETRCVYCGEQMRQYDQVVHYVNHDCGGKGLHALVGHLHLEASAEYQVLLERVSALEDKNRELKEVLSNGYQEAVA